MPEADLLRLCWDYHVNGNRSDALANEVYEIIEVNIKHFGIPQRHGAAVAEDLRQNCCLKVFGYTIGKMMDTSSKSGRLNAHSYIFQACYFEVMQYLRKFKRRKAITFDPVDLNDLLGRLVFDNGEPTIVKEQANG